MLRFMIFPYGTTQQTLFSGPRAPGLPDPYAVVRARLNTIAWPFRYRNRGRCLFQYRNKNFTLVYEHDDQPPSSCALQPLDHFFSHRDQSDFIGVRKLTKIQSSGGSLC